jgi:uncharacterized membrane protein YdjX (TVP38/TMEM64 family)
VSTIVKILKNKKLILVVLAFAILLLFILFGPLKLWDTIRKYTNTQEIDTLINKLRGFGPWTPIISFACLIIQTIIFVIPVWPLATANALIFGVWEGFLLTWIGVIAGSIIAYIIGRTFGMHRLNKYLKLNYLNYVEEFTGKHGFQVLMIAKIIPVTNLDVLSYLSGICKMPVHKFIMATTLGSIPWILLYSIFAHNLLLAKKLSVWIGLGVTAVIIGLIVLRFRKQISAFIKVHQPEAE